MKHYPKAANKRDISTVGVTATLVTRADVPEDIVYALVKVVFDNFDKLIRSHPALEVITKEGMLKGQTAPYHKGAVRYYKEAGLLP